jgi:type VI secretion system FHA domain protein
MALKLTLSGGTAGSATRLLSAGTLSIGRGERNDWTLPDPERHLSKTHCVISVENGRYVLTDLSTNGVYINRARQPTTRDSQTILCDGDEFRIGEYSILIEEVAAPSAATRPLGEMDPLDIDPLDDPLGRPADPAFSHPLRPTHAPVRHDDPFDRRDEERRRAQPDDHDLFNGIKPADEWKGSSQPDNADAPRHAMKMPQVIAPVVPNEIDFDQLIGDLSPSFPTSPTADRAAPTPQSRRAVDPFDRPDQAEYEPLHPVAPPPRQAPSVPQAGAAMPADAALAALRAFLEGAGVPKAPVTGDPEATLRHLGEVFHTLVSGLRDVLMSRAAIKGELRIEQTLLKATDNNALKFSFSPEEAVISLLNRDRPGYMEPLAAAHEAFDDIKMHEFAVMAGVQTALMALLRRFDPDTLEGRLSQGILSGMVPAARKARLWDSFRDVYGTIASEAEDDFQAVFGRAFAKAYEAQSRKRK